jgi:hypothetical protein
MSIKVAVIAFVAMLSISACSNRQTIEDIIQKEAPELFEQQNVLPEDNLTIEDIIEEEEGPLKVVVQVNDDLSTDERANMAVWVVSMELERLGLPENTDLGNIRKFVFMVKQAESSGKRRATSVAEAMSFYQFKPASVKTAVNRFENWTNRHSLPFPEWAEDLRQHPKDIYGLRDSLQAMLMMVNIVEQRGSDDELLGLINGERKAAKELYYVYHHTAPDNQTIALIDRLFPKYFSNS